MKYMPLFLLALGIAFAGCSSKNSVAENAPEPSIHVVTTASSFAQEQNSTIHLASEPDLDDYDDDTAIIENDDPLEGWNRFWFRVNDFFIQYMLKPLHKGYASIVPGPVRSAVSSFSYNALFPVRMLNSLLQGEFAQAGVEFDRSFVNFVLTLGFSDPAAEKKPLFPYQPETENFDHTLARWGVADGPYIIIPFLGPSTIRGAAGTVGDAAMNPKSYLLDWPISTGSTIYFNFNASDELYKAYDAITESALEPYVALRNGYLNRRSRQFFSMAK